MKKKKVIIDCDPGIDDSLAIMLALSSPELQVLGITVVSGNVPARQGVLNTLKVLKLMGRLDIPVYIGEEYPLKRERITAEDTHGIDGLGETFIEEVAEVSYQIGAVDFILDCIKSSDEVSLIALGPLTNIAKAIQKDINTFHKLHEIVSMGGAYKSHGNCSPVAEFNYWVDPHAVKEMLDSSKVPFTMVGLDVTREVVLTPNYIELLKQLNTDKSNFIANITKFYVDFHWKQERTLGCVINDPLAVAYFLNRNLCKGISGFLDIATDGICIGQTVVDAHDFYRKDDNAYILTEVDAHGFMNIFLKRIFPEYEKDINTVLTNPKYSYEEKH